ncbi:amidohydrolase [soil metagenome]
MISLRSVYIAALLFTFTVACDSESNTNPSADLILANAVVWTVDDDNPEAEAVAIRGNKIIGVGSNDDIQELGGENTRIIDLEGAFLLPGFNDNHVHFASAARFLEFNIMRTSTQDEFVERIENVVSRLGNGEWILGGFWGAYDDWEFGSPGGGTGGRFTPDISLVEQITEHHPLFIQRFDRSEYAVNRRAMKEVGLDPDNPQAEGIDFERDGEGNPTGIVTGNRVREFFGEHIPEDFSYDRRVQQTKHALAEIRKYGVTNVSDMSDDTQVEIYEMLRDEGELTTRIHYRYHLERWNELAEQGMEIGSGDDWIRFGSLKGHIDGIMGNSTARFFEPYDHMPDERGSWRRLMVDENGDYDPERFYNYMQQADEAGLQLTIHAIGDEANHLLLNMLERLIEENGEKDRRFRLVHAQVIQDEDIGRLGELNVIAEVQPIHASDDMRWMEERIGTERSRGAYAFNSILQSGAVLSFGTDWPGTAAAEYHISPMYGLYAAVTRKTMTGEPEGGWFPEERISMEEAIRAYTLNTAYANFEDDRKGSITAGKLADITVLDQNLFEVDPMQLPDVEVLYTIVNGKVVYEMP